MIIKNDVIYLFDTKSININQIESFILKYKFIYELNLNNNFSNKNDKKSHLISLFFIIKYLQTNNIPYEKLIFENNHYLIDDNKHHFSISHKDNYVCFISSINPIGIDAEIIVKNSNNINIAKKYFSNYVHSFDNDTFLLCWIKAESLLKCANISFAKACKIINEINVNNIENTYYFKILKHKNMYISVCHKNKIDSEYKIYELNYLPK